MVIFAVNWRFNSVLGHRAPVSLILTTIYMAPIRALNRALKTHSALLLCQVFLILKLIETPDYKVFIVKCVPNWNNIIVFAPFKHFKIWQEFISQCLVFFPIAFNWSICVQTLSFYPHSHPYKEHMPDCLPYLWLTKK